MIRRRGWSEPGKRLGPGRGEPIHLTVSFVVIAEFASLLGTISDSKGGLNPWWGGGISATEPAYYDVGCGKPLKLRTGGQRGV
jgi:hypothetical protein